MARGDYYDPLTGVVRRGGRRPEDEGFVSTARDMILGPGGDVVETYLVNPDDVLQNYDFGNTMQGAEDRSLGLAGQQQSHIDMLRAQAEGRGAPSLAEMQLARALGQVQSQAAGSVASQRGLNPALAARLVGQQQAQAGQQAAGQQAMLRAQEQLAAQQLLGSTLSGVRGQEQTAFGAGMQGNQAQNALQAQMAEQNRQAMQAAQAQSLGLDAAQAQAGRDLTAGLLKTGAETFGKFGTKFDGGVIPRLYAEGGQVPGTAPFPGDVPENDVVPTLLTPEEIVIPRTIATAPDAPQQAEAFVRGIQKGAESARENGDTREAGFVRRLKAGYPDSRAAMLDAQEGGGAPPRGLPAAAPSQAETAAARLEEDRLRKENYPGSRAAMLDSQEGGGQRVRDAYVRSLYEAAKRGDLTRKGLDEYFNVLQSGEIDALKERGEL